MNIQAYAEPDDLPASEATRIARLLAIDEPHDVSDVQLARRVSRGLLPLATAALAEVLGKCYRTSIKNSPLSSAASTAERWGSSLA